MVDHTCTERCSWKQTPQTLIALGYDVIIPARDATVPDKISAEQSFLKARHQAFVDGKTVLCTKTDRQQNIQPTEVGERIRQLADKTLGGGGGERMRATGRKNSFPHGRSRSSKNRSRR